MDPNSRRSLEEEELEDGEICDDEAEVGVPFWRGDGRRPGRGAPPRTRKPHLHPHHMLPHMGHQPPDFRFTGPYGLGPHGPHGPFPPGLRQQCGPSGPDRPPSPPLPALGPHGEPSPRSSFWERSHGALGRFRHRGMADGGRGHWNHGFRGGGGGRAPMGRHGLGEIHGNKTESPGRKQKLPGRNQVRKIVVCVPKAPENNADESFEDLLSKYKQIQLELECIRKEETMVLEPKASPGRQDVPDAESEALAAQSPPGPEETSELESMERKVFQAFNIKPLRQKLSTPAHLDLKTGQVVEDGEEDAEKLDEEEEKKGEGAAEARPEAGNEDKTCPHCCQETDAEEDKAKKTCSCCRESSASSEESAVSPDKPVVKVEEEELSELQLRLLALQSASKKWHQKEQQVMKKSKDRITRASQDKKPVPGPRVTTRSVTSAAAAAAAERSRTRSKPPDRERTKASPKAGPKGPQERGRTPGRLHLAKKMVSPGSVVKQAARKQQLRTWKLQRQQEEKRRQEEEERRKREEEIRRIRDLSNQDEQYNRFMKLVGGRSMTGIKSRDRDYRKSSSKCLDISGNLYQYDNYDEVAMDTDSEPSSPVPSPTHCRFAAEGPGGVLQVSPFELDFSQSFLSPHLAVGPPPPPPFPPPPPEDHDRPPKPPFADEEEEEEMLLRETCLMSMVNKRVATPEERSSPPPGVVQQPSRGNLSTVSLNMATGPRAKFARGHHGPRATLVLPRHKSVVVSLKDSEDSDSEPDSCSSTQQNVFGGLEFMIKEARRTVEAAKPKAASVSEKENNPLRTPEALPEAKRAEYRQLREEIASREKQRLVVPPPGASAPSDSSSQLKLLAAEQRLHKNRELLQRDQAVLKHLLMQELKKKESLKAAEAKVSKLREQLQASEKIVSANRTLLKKLQEQLHRVEHRVSIKKSLSVRLEQEVSQTRQETSKGTKRKTEANHVQTKIQHLDGAAPESKRHFAELLAQKQRLQQLESEYAEKIQRLKEAQAQRKGGGVLTEPPPRGVASVPPEPRIQSLPPSGPFPVPQPSLHDLTQDKLTLDSEDLAEAEEPEPEPAARGLRRLSSSSTKPNLEQLSLCPAKAKTSPTSKGPAETFAGLDLEALKLRYQQRARLGELLQRELENLDERALVPGGTVVLVELDQTRCPSASTELRPVPFGPYSSPLLVFRSYRFSPYYRTKEKLSLSSVTYSNTIEPRKFFCRFDLTGTCNDDDCRWQHVRSCSLTGTQLFQDLLSYNLSLIGCSESSPDEDVGAATETYMKKLFGSNKDRMGVDQKAVLLVSKVNESKRHVPPYTTFKDARRWRPKAATPPGGSEDDREDEPAGGPVPPGGHDGCSKTSLWAADACVTSEDKRYFVSETDDVSNLETSVLENPGDTQLWIKLAFKYLNQTQTSAAEGLDAALNTLSRALESNCEDPEVWSHYLNLFSRRASREEVQEMCEMAVEHAPDQRVWWNYLALEGSVEAKDAVCERLLHFLLAQSPSDRRSFHLTEALLYRVELHLFTGRPAGGRSLLQDALRSPRDAGLWAQLTCGHRALLWLCFIHLTEFGRLPSRPYDPAQSGPSRLLSTAHFLLPWRTAEDISTPRDVLEALFHDAVSQCSDESLSLSQRVEACLPLHTNLLLLHSLLDRLDEGVALCEALLRLRPQACALRDFLSDFLLRSGQEERAVGSWLHALAECPHDAEVFYHCARFLMAQEKPDALAPLFRGFITLLCQDEQSQREPLDVLRHLLGFPCDELLRGPIIKQELQELLRRQRPYLHLIHCRWQWLHGSVDDAVDAFERGLSSSMKLEELHRLWTDYLAFSCRQTGSRLFQALVQRCLTTVPTRLEVPFQPAEFWTCYRFHNQVIVLYVSCVPPAQRTLVLERLRSSMPRNAQLGLRLLQQEWQDGNMEHVQFQSRMLSGNCPKSVSSWKIAVAVETELKRRSEVRRLYNQAAQNLPLCGALWKDRLLFEAAEGPSDRLRRLVDRCQQVGVALPVGGAQVDDR